MWRRKSTEIQRQHYKQKLKHKNRSPMPLSVNDALHFLAKVKTEFQQEPAVYNNFLQVMRDFKSQQLNTQQVVDKILELFQGHDQLICEFNIFLPVELYVTQEQIDAHNQKHPQINDLESLESPNNLESLETPAASVNNTPGFETAIQYVTTVKSRFETETEKWRYSEFLDCLQQYKDNQLNIDEVKNIIMELFSGHPDLLQGFTYFLPESNVNSSIFS
jgi:paired amphipathic helix protein Sin3a